MTLCLANHSQIGSNQSDCACGPACGWNQGIFAGGGLAETVDHGHVPAQRAAQQGKLRHGAGFGLQLVRGQADEMLDLPNEMRLVVEAPVVAQRLPAFMVERDPRAAPRSEEHTSELQSLM